MAKTRNVTAVMGADGKVYFERTPKPARAPMPEWMLVVLSLLVVSAVVATALAAI